MERSCCVDSLRYIVEIGFGAQVFLDVIKEREREREERESGIIVTIF